MTHREDNSLLDAVEQRMRDNDEIAKALDTITALIAFGAFCIAMYVALHLDVIPL